MWTGTFRKSSLISEEEYYVFLKGKSFDTLCIERPLFIGCLWWLQPGFRKWIYHRFSCLLDFSWFDGWLSMLTLNGCSQLAEPSSLLLCICTNDQVLISTLSTDALNQNDREKPLVDCVALSEILGERWAEALAFFCESLHSVPTGMHGDTWSPWIAWNVWTSMRRSVSAVFLGRSTERTYTFHQVRLRTRTIMNHYEQETWVSSLGYSFLWSLMWLICQLGSQVPRMETEPCYC